MGLSLNADSASRLDRLRSSCPETESWPVFQRLYAMLDGTAVTFEVTAPEFDALFAVLQFLRNEPSIELQDFDTFGNALVGKLKNKGGGKCDPSQIQDIVYELEVALLLTRTMPGSAQIELIDRDRPDHVFTVHFQSSDQPSKIAIECKNIRGHGADLTKLIRSVVRAIIDAKRQHRSRSADFTDLIIFIDLPLAVLSYTEADYCRLIVNVWSRLRQRYFAETDLTQVLFTATSQAGMADHLKTTPSHSPGLALIRPYVVDASTVWIRSPRLVFLSFLFRRPDENLSGYAWSNHAVRINNPHDFLL